MSLVTLAEIKTYLGITNDAQDALLTIFQESVEQSVLKYCACAFEPTVVTGELHDGINADVLTPKWHPIISIQAISFYVETDGSGGSQLDTDEYSHDDVAIYFRYRNTPQTARAIIRLDYTHGYTETPGDVKLAIFQAVKAEFQRRDDNTEHIGSRSKENESENYGAAWDETTGLPKQIVNKLRPYKSVDFPVIGMAQRNR